MSADYLVKDEEQATVKNDQNAKNIAKLTREREKIRAKAKQFYYCGWANMLMGISMML